jgi:hypothetical protein
MEKFWKQYGSDIVAVLDYSDTSLIKSTTDEEISEFEKSSISEYFEKVTSSSQ